MMNFKFHFRNEHGSTLHACESLVIRKSRVHCDLKKGKKNPRSQYRFNFTNGFFLLIFTIVMFIITLLYYVYPSQPNIY